MIHLPAPNTSPLQSLKATSFWLEPYALPGSGNKILRSPEILGGCTGHSEPDGLGPDYL